MRSYVIPNSNVSRRNFFDVCSLFPLNLQRSDATEECSAEAEAFSMWTALLNELREIVVLASIIGGLLGVSVGLAAALAVIV